MRENKNRAAENESKPSVLVFALRVLTCYNAHSDQQVSPDLTQLTLDCFCFLCRAANFCMLRLEWKESVTQNQMRFHLRITKNKNDTVFPVMPGQGQVTMGNRLWQFYPIRMASAGAPLLKERRIYLCWAVKGPSCRGTPRGTTAVSQTPCRSSAFAHTGRSWRAASCVPWWSRDGGRGIAQERERERERSKD